MRIRTLVVGVSLAVVVIATASCGDVVTSNDAPVLLVVNSLAGGTEATSVLSSDVVVNRTSPAPCSVAAPCPTIVGDPGSATLAVIMKDVTLAPSTNNRVTISRYRVEYQRADGHNRPGVDVPFPFDGAVTATITGNSTGSVGFELVRNIAKAESPLIELRFNPDVVTTIASVTFFGTDQVGNDVSATGSIQINFADFGD